MDELEERLQQLALEAQQHSPQTRGRRLALTRLIQMIQTSGRLSRRSYVLINIFSDIFDIF
ncbi:MAG: hypothetical protein F6K26_36870 [Moorea sp. SIO2I5]|nr:hypothetical protein [Moorena sp. SIO2I5]